MFEDWKRAWQQAVDNFQHELADDEGPPAPAQLVGMRRDLAAARKALEKLGIELERCREEFAEEENQEQICRRRGELAAAISDTTTVTIAAEWAERHRQRALILRQKSEVLAAELAMRNDDLAAMQTQIDEQQSRLAAAGPSAGINSSLHSSPERQKHDAEFRQLDRDRRERAAEVRLEELKKSMR